MRVNGSEKDRQEPLISVACASVITEPLERRKITIQATILKYLNQTSQKRTLMTATTNKVCSWINKFERF